MSYRTLMLISSDEVIPQHICSIVSRHTGMPRHKPVAEHCPGGGVKHFWRCRK